MNKLKITAIMLCLLVITLPVAAAARLEVKQYSGQDNVNGFIRPFNETITIIADAEMQGSPTPEVAKARIRFCPEGEQCAYFDACAVSGAVYNCRYSIASAINSGEAKYIIKLFDANDYEIESKEITIRVDEYGPKIIDYEITPLLARTGDMAISYRAEDYSIRAGDISYCSGLKEVKITAGGTEIKRETPGLNACEKQDRFSYTYPTTQDYFGVDVCIQAKDQFGQETVPQCKMFQIDNRPPRFTGLKLRDPQGYELSHMKSGQAIIADVYVTIEEEGGIQMNTVKADLSRLNPSVQERGPDEKIGNDYVWRDIPVTRPEDCAVSARATDEIGNTGNATLTCSLPLDNTGPSPATLSTDAMDSNGTAILAAAGNIYAELDEAESGMDKGQAYLDLHRIGLATDVKAGKCEQATGTTWKCTWSNVKPTVSSGNYTIKLTQQTRDDAGNIASTALEVPVIVDKQAPAIKNVDVVFVHQTADYGPRAINGDSIEFNFNMTGASEGYADLTQVGGVEDTPATECTPDGCKFDILIDATGPQNTTIDFEFYDDAKNKIDYSYDFFLYGVLNDTAINYWNTTVTCSPRMLDRATAGFHEHPYYCHVKLKPVNKNAEPVYTEVGEMAECTGDGVAYLTEMEAINNQFGSRDPYVVFTLAATDYTVNELKFSCPIYITSRVGDYFSPFAEKENVSVTVSFYSLPYGELYSNVEDHIQDTMERNVETLAWVTMIEDWVELGRTACNIKNTLSTIIGAIDAVLLLLTSSILTAWFFCDVLELGCNYHNALENTRSVLCGDAAGPISKLYTGLTSEIAKQAGLGGSGKSQFNLLDFLCKYANCQLTEADEGKAIVEGVDVIGVFNNPICKGVQDWQRMFLDLDLSEHDTGSSRPPTDVKENLVLSAACLCLPGITYNLNKIRQINCQYAVCLGSKVLEEGLPTSYCHDERSYMVCNYVMGQIFDLIPFAWLYNQISSMAQDFYANPISIVAAVSGCICGGCTKKMFNWDYCNQEKEATGLTGVLYAYCTVAKTAAKVGDAIAAVRQMEGMEWKMQTSNEWCEQAEELLE